ncbi:MAG: ribosome biogenesis GTPase YlqF [Clostridia bacterium]|nr:ribosome biogenesis GTPase YlqF [Clostridia bacterium]
MQIQWYPGHMAKAKRKLIEQLGRVDAVIELCDARLPFSSRNPDLFGLLAGKKKLLVLGKADLADEAETKRWTAYFSSCGEAVFAYDAVRGNAQEATRHIEKITRETVEKQAARGIRKTVRAMVVGVPNVGKSTFINRLNRTPVAKTADRPGVTRQTSWVRVNPYLELMDTPGLLWPRIDDRLAATRLAWLGTIRDEILDQEALAISLLETLAAIRPDAVMKRYKLNDISLFGHSLLEAVCLGRGFLMAGGIPDTDRAAAIVLDEFRAGKLSRITLETRPGAL